MTMEKAVEATRWPTPFYKDPTDPWPVSRYFFHERQRKVWPMSHVKPGLGELKFMNWTLSFLADKVKNTSRDFIGVLKGASEEMKSNILSGRDLTLLEFEKIQGSISNVIQFLQHPPFNKDILEVYNMTRREWEQRTGLSMLMYGETQHQLRSATDAENKMGQMRIRPDDMARMVEQSSTLTARKELIAAYWHYLPQHVARLLGPERAMVYMQHVMSKSLEDIVYELDVRIEAGSIRKPNREREVANANMGVQVWQGLMQGYAQATGDFEPIKWLGELWAKAYDMEHEFPVLQAPQPNQGEEQAQQQQLQAQQMEMQMKQQEHQMKLQQKSEEHQLSMQMKQQEAGLKAQIDSMLGETKLQINQAAGDQDMSQDQEEHLQELSQDQEQHLLDMMQARSKGLLELELKRKLANTQAGNNGSNRQPV
jgi:hypothetical protein